jgi:hypothetical protein
MSAWNDEELRILDRVREIRVTGRREDGSLRRLTIVWQVVVNGKLYVRSVRGIDGRWYKGVITHYEGAIDFDGQTRSVTYIPDHSVDDLIDAAYFAKYGNGSSSQAIINMTANATTLRIEPLQNSGQNPTL